MRYAKLFFTICGVLTLTQTGCRRQWDLTKPACKKAIDEYYSNRPECLREAPDPRHPELGNLCIGYRSVVSIDSFTPPWNGMPRTSHVAYHYTIGRVPDWAQSPAILQTYPQLRDALTGPHQATENLVGGSAKDDSYVWEVIPPGQTVE